MLSAEAVAAEDTLVHVLWINAGLSCDGDSVALTAATQPSIEEIALGALPGLPKVAAALAADRLRVRTGGGRRLHRVVLEGRPRRARAVRPRRRGLDPQRGDQAARATGRLRQRPDDRPADHDQRVDRPARARRRWPSSPSAPARPTAASTRWPATRPARWACPTTSAGTGSRKAGLPIVCVPGLPGPAATTCPRRSLYLLYQATGQAPMIPLDEALRPTWLFGQTVHEGCDRGRLLRAGRLRRRVRLAEVHREARLLGPGGEVQRPQARLDGRHRRLPQRRRHLHRLHDARLPRQVHAVHGRAARRASCRRRRSASTAGRSAALRSITTDDRSTRSRSGGSRRRTELTDRLPTP